MASGKPTHTVDDLFRKSSPVVRATYDAIIKVVGDFGSVQIDPKKTSIHLVRKTAFGGIAAQKHALVLTVKSSTAIESSRVHRLERTSANRWHAEFKLASPEEVDREILDLLRAGYDLSG